MAKTGRRLSPAARTEERAAWTFMAPWFLGVVAVTIGPMLASLYLSFTDYNLLRAPEWVGVENYTEMFRDPRLHKAITVTLIYTFVSVPLQLTVALALAMLLNQGIKGLPFYRSVYYLPSLLGGSVAVGILWRQVFGVDGLVNQFLGLFGIDGPGWISHPDTALSTLIVLQVWTFGAAMVIFLAGLRQVPEHLYEASALDGAGRWDQFRHVTLPMLTPIIFFNLVMQIISAFQAFTPAFIVGGGSTGGPLDSLLFYTLYLYFLGFVEFRMGYASAMAWALLVIILFFTALLFFTSRWWVYYGDE
jgi:multiple sugar transport system permease protein